MFSWIYLLLSSQRWLAGWISFYCFKLNEFTGYAVTTMNYVKSALLALWECLFEFLLYYHVSAILLKNYWFNIERYLPDKQWQQWILSQERKTKRAVRPRPVQRRRGRARPTPADGTCAWMLVPSVNNLLYLIICNILHLTRK